ncbi:MAG: alpha-2-macroglobulin, partial [Sphingomonas sp.]|nr:alpha-2-macroglobulin [Sphingomonas sp.]
LPGGTACTFALVEGLRSAAGYVVGGQRQFRVDAGGPVARAVLPSRYGSEVEEDQVFLVAANMPATRASVAANAYCAVDGIGEKVPVDVLDDDIPAQLLGELGTDNYQVSSFLEEAGLPATLPTATADRKAALASVTALKCRRPLPPGRDVALIWSGQIAGAGGKLAGVDQRFDFTVRKPFAARFECSRVNPQAGCSPVEKAWVRFSAPIPMAMARQIRIETATGTRIAPKFGDDGARGDTRTAATISDIGFAAPLPAATTATLVLPAGIKDESGRALTNATRFPLAIRFDEAPPLVKFAASFGILEAKQGGILPVTVRGVEPALQGRTQAISGQALRVEGSDGDIARWLRTVARADDYASHEEKRGTETVTINDTGSKPVLTGGRGSALSVALPGKGKDFEVVGVPLAKPGFYVVELASPRLGAALLGRNAPRYVASSALVTNMSVHFKWGRGASLAWVTTLDGAKPVAGADVRVTDSCDGRTLATGRTDSSGAVRFTSGVDDPESYASCPRAESDDAGSGAHPLMISARKGGDFSFTLTDWGEGIRPYDFDLPYGYDARGDIFHTVFDRALVRQGEPIHMKHILRAPVAAGFEVSGGFSATLRLQHRGSDTQFDLPLTIDANGIGESVWTAPKAAPMGDYELQMIRGDNTIYSGQSFKVDEYRLPTMRATVSGPKEAVVKPKSLPLDLFVGFLSGGGAANLPVDLRIGWFGGVPTPDGYESYDFGGKALREGVRPLNGDGEEEAGTLPPTQTLPAKLSADGTARQSIDIPQSLDGAANMRVEMDYQDANGETLTASRSIAIYPSAVQLGLKTDGWLMKADDLRLRLVALDTEGKPIAGQQIAVALYSREILTARRRLIGGFYAYDNQVKTTKLAAACTATTDAQGLAVCKIDPGVSGEVYAVATTADARGNVARATRSVWLAGEDDWWFGGDNGDRMDLIPEQLAYKAGETGKFQVRMPFRRATALVTVEREGVLTHFVTELSGKDPVVEVKMPGTYAPDVFVSVLAVRGRVQAGFWDWLSNIGAWFGLASKAEPAPPATALIDLAKPAYRLGIAKVKVGWEGHRLGVTVKSDKARYAARETAQVDIAVTRPDGKPAARADVAFIAVDQALEQLAPNNSTDVLSAMMGERPLSVLTATAQTQVVGNRHFGKKAVVAGGDGGEGEAAALNRENFQPVLLWRGRVALDARGRARVPVVLNDALTGFRLVAVATDGAALFGSGTAQIRSAQDLSIFSGIPPLVRSGDQFGAIFTLRNGSDKPMTVTATVDITPAIASGRPLTVTIPAGGAAPVMWRLTAPENMGALRWQVRAESAGGKAADQISVDQQIVPAVPIETWAATLTRVGGAPIPVMAPAGALAGRGGVEVRLTDSLAPPLAGVQRYMTAYPYDCFEQRLSRIVALGDAGGWTRLAGDMPTYQAPDGLLRYWPSDSLEGSEALTAYVLALTSEAGLPIPDGPRARMIDGLKAVIDGRLARESYGDARLRRLVAFAALARAGAATTVMVGQLQLAPRDMPTAQLGDYLSAIDRVPGLANAQALRAAGEAVLRTRLVYEGTRLDLSDQGSAAWWLMSSGDEAAIKALLAVLGKPGWQDDGPRMMVGVSLRQQRGHWDTTTANAWGTIAARKFASVYPASAVAGVTTATLGTTTISRVWPLAEPQRLLSFPLPRSRTPLALAQSGGAGPWAGVQVAAAVPLRAPLFAGYRLARKVEVVQARQPGRYSRGDVIKVTITVEASAERNWVVISDPLPAGATIIGDQGGQSTLLNASSSSGGYPSYVERGGATWRGYYAWMPRGTTSVSYSVRLNGVGRFNLPPTHVEAMYSPAIHADLPNAPVTVAAN